MSEANRQALATLDSALFVLSLDDAEVDNETDATHTLLHNYGANRYTVHVPKVHSGSVDPRKLHVGVLYILYYIYT